MNGLNGDVQKTTVESDTPWAAFQSWMRDNPDKTVVFNWYGSQQSVEIYYIQK